MKSESGHTKGANDLLAHLDEAINRITFDSEEDASLMPSASALIQQLLRKQSEILEAAAVTAERFATDYRIAPHLKKKRFTEAEVMSRMQIAMTGAARAIAEDIRALKVSP